MFPSKNSLFLDIVKSIKHSFFFISDDDRWRFPNQSNELLENKRIGKNRLTIGDNQPKNNDSFKEISIGKNPYTILSIIFGSLSDDTVCEIETNDISKKIKLLPHLWSYYQ